MGMGVGGGFKSKISSIGQPDSAIKLQSYSHFADMKLGNYVWTEKSVHLESHYFNSNTIFYPMKLMLYKQVNIY